MAIDRTVEGLIEAQFQLADEVLESEDMDVSKKIQNVTRLVSGVRGLAALKIAHMREIARVPDLPARDKPLALNGRAEDKQGD